MRYTVGVDTMRCTCGPPFTLDGRWVVVKQVVSGERIVFDPSNGDPMVDIWDCHDFMREAADLTFP